MFDKLLQIIAPHYCYSCGITGTSLCLSCEYDITSEPYSACFVCRRPSRRGVCPHHSSGISQAWVVSEREGALERLIDAYKFERLRSGSVTLVRLLDTVLPNLPADVTVTAVPTVRSHIRVRGYDHAELLAKRFATKRNLSYRQLLTRRANNVQRGASRAVRKKQAAAAFAPCLSDIPASVLLIDDVVTTGFTLLYAAKTLRQAGVETVYVAAIAKQPLDQKQKI
jgi:ComF family protein